MNSRSEWARKFREKAEQMQNSPIPEDVDPVLWRAAIDAGFSMAEELDTDDEPDTTDHNLKD